MWAPLTGVGVFVLVVVSIIVGGGEPPSVEDDDVAEIVEHYVDNKDAVIASSIIGGLVATLLVFFGGYLRKVLRAAEGERGMLSAVAFAGTIIFAVGAAIDSTISFALADTVDDLEPASVQTLQALWDNDFIPFAVGSQVVLLAAGLSIVRHGALPKWLGWVAIVLGIIAVSPIGFASFIGLGIWILIVSVLLTMRVREEPPPVAPTTPPPAAPQA
jgi:hypothetical protein